MPGQLVKELLNGGLVTKRHPTMLSPGELQQADDCVYRQFDPAVHGAPGRTEFNSTAIGSPSPIKGLAYMAFDRNDDLLLEYDTTTLRYAPFTALTGSFTQLTNVGTLRNDGNESMDIIAFGDRYYILTNGSVPRRIGYINPQLTVDALSTIGGDGVTVTTTTAKGFKNVIVGQSVSGTGIPANTRVASKTSDTVIVLDTVSSVGPVTITFLSTPYIQAQISGLLPVASNPTVEVVSGTWSTTSDMGVGFYWFIYTEMVKPGEVNDLASGFLESGFTGTMQVAQISNAATQAIKVTRATNVVNTVANGSNAATHWQVYMSSITADATNKPSLATFRRIGSPISIEVTNFTFSDSSLTQGTKRPTDNTTITGVTSLGTPSGAHTPFDGSRALNPNHDATRGNIFRTFGFVSSGAVNGGTLTGSEAVVGIRVTINGRNAIGTIVMKTSTKVSSERQFSLGIRGTGYLDGGNEFDNIGGSTDTWAETWVPSDFVNGTFTLELKCKKIPGTDNGEIDGIGVVVHYTGTTVNMNGEPFRTVTFRSQVGTTVTDTVNFPPPQATTGDVFQGSMVLNDLLEPSHIRWSLPGNADSFAKPYFMKFNSIKKDTVTNIKLLGQILCVGLRDSIKRVNYLPTELDTDFTSGVAHEDLATDHGIVGPLAATKFDMPGGGVMLAYVSFKGIHFTDGISTRFLSADLDWVNTVDLNNISSCVLRDYPQENWLVLYYAPAGTSHGKNTRALVFSYSPDKIKEDGSLPAMGPMKISARSAATASLNGKTYLLTGHQALGKVYVEDQALALPPSYTVANSAGSEAAITLVPTFKTRRVYPSDIGHQTREQRLYVMTDPFGSTVTASSNTTVSSLAVSSTTAFGSVSVGMIVTGSGIQPDTVVTAKADSSNITISKVALATATGVTLSFSSGTIGITVRGQDIGESVAALETVYQSTETGGLIVYHADNIKEAMELQVSKVILPDTTTAALGVGMRIHYFAYMAQMAGQEVHRG